MWPQNKNSSTSSNACVSIIKSKEKNIYETNNRGPKGHGYLKLRSNFFILGVLTISNVKWHIDSSCLKHMPVDKTLFSSFFSKKGEFVSDGDNKGEILGFGTKSPRPTIREGFLVKGLKHNLLSLSWLCDKGKKLTFD